MTITPASIKLQIKDQDIQINHLIAQQLYIEKHAL